jgi:cytidine deaminase
VVVSELDRRTDELREAARAAFERAYCPYSHYPVGAAVRTASGAVHVGCNVENAAYPLGICAETAALAAMALAGERRVVEVVTVTNGPTPGTPCGGCRQRIREFADPQAVVHATSVDGAVVTMTMAELLPHAFGPDHLEPES